MKRTIIAVGLLALGGCSTLTTLVGSTVSPQQVIIAANSFDAAEATATNYLKLPACPGAPICRSVAGVNAIVPAIRAAREARTALEGFVSSNPGQPAPVSLYDTLTTAITTLESVLAQYNAQKGS